MLLPNHWRTIHFRGKCDAVFPSARQSNRIRRNRDTFETEIGVDQTYISQSKPLERTRVFTWTKFENVAPHTYK